MPRHTEGRSATHSQRLDRPGLAVLESLTSVLELVAAQPRRSRQKRYGPLRVYAGFRCSADGAPCRTVTQFSSRARDRCAKAARDFAAAATLTARLGPLTREVERRKIALLAGEGLAPGVPPR